MKKSLLKEVKYNKLKERIYETNEKMGRAAAEEAKKNH